MGSLPACAPAINLTAWEKAGQNPTRLLLATRPLDRSVLLLQTCFQTSQTVKKFWLDTISGWVQQAHAGNPRCVG